MTIYNKLVRDRIPEIIRANGSIPYTHIARGSELEDALWQKIDEEFEELKNADATKAPEEFADVLEVLFAIRDLYSAQGQEFMQLRDIAETADFVYVVADQYGISRSELDSVRRQKAEERGAFSSGIILEETQ